MRRFLGGLILPHGGRPNWQDEKPDPDFPALGTLNRQSLAFFAPWRENGKAAQENRLPIKGKACIIWQEVMGSKPLFFPSSGTILERNGQRFAPFAPWRENVFYRGGSPGRSAYRFGKSTPLPMSKARIDSHNEQYQTVKG